ncbi:MAG TPA: hypothetical protein VEB66_11715 [Opitutaceae bacterium]|nr:hypothetical protein [Opitutaceae bacterium]
MPSSLRVITQATLGCLLASVLQAEPLPAEIVGEWAAPGSRFGRGALTRGSALYLAGDGTAVLLGAPPPIGIRGQATYDPSTRRLTIALFDDDNGGRVRDTTVFIHDPRRQSLAALTDATGKNAFRRRRPAVPEEILAEARRAEARSREQPPKGHRERLPTRESP